MDKLYHYCSPSVFLSIIKNNSAWMTALDQSNDGLEGDWVIRYWLDRFDGERRNKRTAAWEAVKFVKSRLTALGICFSEEKDLLSQWRGYAQDGAGFSIHFDSGVLLDVISEQPEGSKISLEKIRYGSSEIEHVNDIVRALYEAFKDDFEHHNPQSNYLSFQSDEESRAKKEPVISRLYTVKNSAFKEEREWRLLLVQPAHKVSKIDFREARGIISPYLPIADIRRAITGVTLGPTNRTPPHVITALLNQHGIQAEVKSSTASYRN